MKDYDRGKTNIKDSFKSHITEQKFVANKIGKGN